MAGFAHHMENNDTANVRWRCDFWWELQKLFFSVNDVSLAMIGKEIPYDSGGLICWLLFIHVTLRWFYKLIIKFLSFPVSLYCKPVIPLCPIPSWKLPLETRTISNDFTSTTTNKNFLLFIDPVPMIYSVRFWDIDELHTFFFRWIFWRFHYDLLYKQSTSSAT